MHSGNILEHGARGDGVTDDTSAIQAAIDQCASSGGGRVIVRSGRTFLSGPIELHSNVDLHVETAACLAAIPDRSRYPDEVFPGSLDGRKWIHASDAENVAVTGDGVIDGRGTALTTREMPDRLRPTYGRAFTLHFEGCRRVMVRDLTLRDSAFWCVHLLGCEDVLVNNVRILNNLEMPNCDGVNPNRSRNVRIIDCTIEAGDDCISVKSEAGYEKYGATEDLVVKGCTLQSTAGAIKIGSGTHGEFRRLLLDSCVIKASHRGLGIQLRDGGLIEDVVFSNMVVETRHVNPRWWGDAMPIHLTAAERRPGSPLGSVRNVRFSNISCRSENGVYVGAERAGAIEGICLDNVSLHLDRWTDYPGGYVDWRPCAAKPAKRDTPTSGFHFASASNVTVRDCSVSWGDDLPEYYRHAIYGRNAPGLRIENFRGKAAFPRDHEAVCLEEDPLP
jgi:hypothetical protein